jgi:methionine aminopeptidase
MSAREAALWNAQLKAAALFERVVEQGLIRAGVLESLINEQIHALAREEFGVKRHWHRRIVRSGPNTLLTYFDEAPDREIAADDVVYLDFGPVFGEWEADFGRTYVVGADPRKHRLVRDITEAFALGKSLFEREMNLTAGALYDYVAALAVERGWTFGGPTAGHLVDHFPHASDPLRRFDIRSGNPVSLREPFEDGRPRHWILEIHFVDTVRGYGGFLEELLTVHGPAE